MGAWVGDDGRIVEQGPFDQDREPPEVPLAEWERESHDHPDDEVSYDDAVALSTAAHDDPAEAEAPDLRCLRCGAMPGQAHSEACLDWRHLEAQADAIVGRSPVYASAERVDAIEHKLDKLIALLTPPRLPIDTPDIAVVDGPMPPTARANLGLPATEMTPAQDRAHAQEVAQSARVEAAKAEMEARQAHAAHAIDPAEAVAQGIGYTTDLGQALEIGDRPGFRDQPAMPDDYDGGM